jgi:hypothetical protein
LKERGGDSGNRKQISTPLDLTTRTWQASKLSKFFRKLCR